MSHFPYLGFGLGLRPPHYEAILDTKPDIDWFEVLTDDYFVAGGYQRHFLNKICENYPVVMHGVGLSIGSSDPLNQEYLQQVKSLANEIQPRWVSDHLCWTGVNQFFTHDLLPLPYTELTLKHVVERVQKVQDYLGRQILLENLSSYLTYQMAEIPEWEFLNAVAEQADCLILLDINNIYVSSVNHAFDPHVYLQAIHPKRVQQFHIAGHSNEGTHIIDTHDQPIIDPVWNLYAAAMKRFGKVSTLLERDADIPPLAELVAELMQAKKIATPILLGQNT